jgi:hypothetical protein
MAMEKKAAVKRMTKTAPTRRMTKAAPTRAMTKAAPAKAMKPSAIKAMGKKVSAMMRKLSPGEKRAMLAEIRKS